jgi:hypothetical protein
MESRRRQRVGQNPAYTFPWQSDNHKVRQLGERSCSAYCGLQKVSAQVEMNQTAPRMVVDNE